MKSIKLPSTLKKIEAGAFYDTKIYNFKIDVPEKTEEISINRIGQSNCWIVNLPLLLNEIKRAATR